MLGPLFCHHLEAKLQSTQVALRNVAAHTVMELGIFNQERSDTSLTSIALYLLSVRRVTISYFVVVDCCLFVLVYSFGLCYRYSFCTAE